MTKPVLIAGAGPVGLTMAAELARFQVPVRIIERAAQRSDKSKALAVWSRTVELLDRAGCAEDFIAAGMKCRAVNFMSGKEELAKVKLDSVDSPFRYVLLLPQSETERLLEEHFESLGGKVERGVELTGFQQTADGVQCNVRSADGSEETIEASWLVGCDGAHSVVRQQLGMQFVGETFPSNFMLADVHVTGMPFEDSEMAIFWHQDGVLAFFPITPGRYRVMGDVGDAPRHDPTLEEVQAIVDERGPGGLKLTDPVWLAGFGVNERKVENFRAGRVFVAGDAAHIHSPAGGQGMNTGMQDAMNLAWKLALVEQGTAEESLLETYSQERSAVAAEVLAESGHMIRLAVVKNRLVQHVRNFVAHHLLGFSAAQHALAEQLSEIKVGYRHSALNAGTAKGLHGPKPGERIVYELPLGTSSTPQFTLLAEHSAEAHRFVVDHAPLVAEEICTPPDAKGMWLVRPDGYVAAVARAGQWEVMEGWLEQLAGQKAALVTR